MNREIDRQRAISNLRQEAQRRVVKSEVMKFRLEEDTLERLLEMAKKLNTPVGTLVREWIIEKLEEAEIQSKETPEITAINIIAESLAERGILRDDQVSRIQQLLDHGPLVDDRIVSLSDQPVADAASISESS